MPNMFTQMDAVCHRFEELSIRLNQPDTAADPALSVSYTHLTLPTKLEV